MKLMTKELEKRFKEVGSQINADDPIVIAKYFYPGGIGSWYAVSYNPKDGSFFGLVTILDSEVGFFSLKELEDFVGWSKLGIERDLHWKEVPLSHVKKIIDLT